MCPPEEQAAPSNEFDVRSPSGKREWEIINMETIIILMLIAFIGGLVMGVALARPNSTR